MKKLIIVVLVLCAGIFFYLNNKQIKEIELKYPALKTDYTSSKILSREGAWMIWDIPEKQTTVVASSVFDEDVDKTKFLKQVCNPTEVEYKKDVTIYDCGTFYGIFILGNPPSPTLYGPFEK